MRHNERTRVLQQYKASIDADVSRLREVYRSRSDDPRMRGRYSRANPGNAFNADQLARELAAAIARHLNGWFDNVDVLDVGCGTGTLLDELSRSGLQPDHFWGIDLMADRIDQALKLHPEARFLVGSADRMPFPDASFDVVCQFTFVSSILSSSLREAVAAEMDRVLRPGGHIIWYDFWLNPRNRHTRGINRGVIQSLFPEYDMDARQITLLPPLARVLGRRAHRLLRPLCTIPVLRGHHLVVLSKPSAHLIEPPERTASAIRWGCRTAYLVSDDHRWQAEELFQLLRIPVEPYSTEAEYDCVVSDGTIPESRNYGVLIVYTSDPLTLDTRLGLRVAAITVERIWSVSRNQEIPIGISLSEIAGAGEPLLFSISGRQVGASVATGGITAARFGFDLFAEIARLLRDGQTEEDGNFPTLDLLVDLVRRELQRHILLMEVPPIPWGHDLVLTLSHDIDHLSLREHGFGERWISFLRQSLWWSFVAWHRGRISLRALLGAWQMALLSPLIMVGLVADPWEDIDAYIPLEAAHGALSAYYFIPRRGDAGIDRRGQANHRRRAADYDIGSGRSLVQSLAQAGVEVGLHGLNAWHSTEEARIERDRILEATDVLPDGVRMHFLYYDRDSLQCLDQAGFAYDTSVGYPRQTGFRAGTLQPYRPRGSHSLLELPVQLEDGGLLSIVGQFARPREAHAIIDFFLDHARQFGGTLNASWHDHSLGPPRYWAESYRYLLRRARTDGAWMTRPCDAAAWFNWRRRVTLRVIGQSSNELVVQVSVPHGWPEALPGARFRLHHSPVEGDVRPYTDLPLRNGRVLVRLQDNRPVAAYEQV